MMRSLCDLPIDSAIDDSTGTMSAYATAKKEVTKHSVNNVS
jgi:hypothetical protein